MSWKRSRLEPRWSLLLLSLLQATRGSFGDEKGGMGSGSSGGGSMSSGAETSHMSSSMEQTPEQAYFNLIMKQKYDADKKDMMAAHAHAAHTHPHPHTDMMKMGNKEMRKPSKITSTRKGRGKKGDKKMQMMYLGLMYIKSVIQMVMMAIGQVLQFKSVVISLVSVMIQVAQFVMMLRQKHAVKAHGYHGGKLAPVESSGVGWGGGSGYDHDSSSDIVEDGGLGTYAGYRYDQGNAPAPGPGAGPAQGNNPDLGHYTYGPSYKH